MPVHFYTPIAEVWRFADGRRSPERPDPTGISLRTDEAMALLERLAAAYGEEYRPFPDEPTDDPHGTASRTSASVAGTESCSMPCSGT